MTTLSLATTLCMLGTISDGSPVEVVGELLRRINEHDVAAAYAMLTADFEFRDGDGTFVLHRQEARSMLEWDAAVRSRAEIAVLDVRPDSVTVQLTESNAFFDAIGVESISHRVTYVVAGGSISAIVLHQAEAVGAKVEEALSPALEWARRERPDALAAVTTGGTPVYTGDSAVRWLALLDEARRAGALEP